MFFSKFQNIEYDGFSMKDLSTAVVIKQAVKENKDLYFWYEMEDWETPESVAFDHYGNTNLNYVILLMNDIVDPFFDWPLNYNELIRLCEGRYGAPTVTNNQYNVNGFNTVAYFRAPNGIIYQPDAPTIPFGSTPITYFEHEQTLNDDKRRIKILHAELIGQMNRELDIIFNG